LDLTSELNSAGRMIP